MGAHQHAASLVLDRARHVRADGRRWVTLDGDEVEIVALAGAGDTRLDTAPEQNAVVGWLATAARIERRTIQHDAALGVAREHRAGPFAKRGIGKVEPLGPA